MSPALFQCVAQDLSYLSANYCFSFWYKTQKIKAIYVSIFISSCIKLKNQNSGLKSFMGHGSIQHIASQEFCNGLMKWTRQKFKLITHKGLKVTEV